MTNGEYDQLKSGDYISYKWDDGEQTILKVLKPDNITRFKVILRINRISRTTFDEVTLCANQRMAKITFTDAAIYKLQNKG